MSDIIVSGTIVQALPLRQGVSQTGNQWQRQSFIIEHEHGQYPKKLVFDAPHAKIQEFGLKVGEEVTIHLNCDVREYPQGSGKFFNSISAWKVERQSQQQDPMPQQQYQAPPTGSNQVIYQNQPPQGSQLPF